MDEANREWVSQTAPRRFVEVVGDPNPWADAPSRARTTITLTANTSKPLDLPQAEEGRKAGH